MSSTAHPQYPLQWEGTLTHWQDDRGFGFIQPSQGGEHVFVHIRAFKSLEGRPRLNQRVLFQVKTTTQGKKRAVNVLACEPGVQPRTSPSHAHRTFVATAAGAATLGLLWWYGLSAWGPPAT